MKMICDICGFDPVLYKRSPQRAADLVKIFLEKRKTDPQMLLKPYPKLATIKKRAVRPDPGLLTKLEKKSVAKPPENTMKA